MRYSISAHFIREIRTTVTRTRDVPRGWLTLAFTDDKGDTQEITFFPAAGLDAAELLEVTEPATPPEPQLVFIPRDDIPY